MVPMALADTSTDFWGWMVPEAATTAVRSRSSTSAVSTRWLVSRRLRLTPTSASTTTTRITIGSHFFTVYLPRR